MPGPGKPFSKGKTGNPRGRPRDSELADARALAQAKTAEAMKVLVQVATKGKSESARVAAATALLDRGWGKPTQPVSGEDGDPIRIIVETGIDRG